MATTRNDCDRLLRRGIGFASISGNGTRRKGRPRCQTDQKWCWREWSIGGSALIAHGPFRPISNSSPDPWRSTGSVSRVVTILQNQSIRLNIRRSDQIILMFEITFGHLTVTCITCKEFLVVLEL